MDTHEVALTSLLDIVVASLRGGYIESYVAGGKLRHSEAANPRESVCLKFSHFNVWKQRILFTYNILYQRCLIYCIHSLQEMSICSI